MEKIIAAFVDVCSMGRKRMPESEKVIATGVCARPARWEEAEYLTGKTLLEDGGTKIFIALINLASKTKRWMELYNESRDELINLKMDLETDLKKSPAPKAKRGKRKLPQATIDRWQ